MKFTPDGLGPNQDELVLSRRNLEALLEKLGDPLSARLLMKSAETGDRQIWLKAEEDDVHYGERAPGAVYMPSTNTHL